MIAVPPTLRIGARDFVVEFHDMDEHGNSDCVRQKIRIKRSILASPVETLDTLLHEFLHVIDYQARLDLGEDRIHRTAFQLAVFLVENGLLSERLMRDKCGGEQ